MRLSAALLVVALLGIPRPALAIQTYFGYVDPGAVEPAGCPGYSQYSASSGPAGLTVTCGDNTGAGTASSFMAEGHVGASANAASVGGLFIYTSLASWGDDSVLITAVGNPGFIGTTTASLNFEFSGSLGGVGAPVSTSLIDLSMLVDTVGFDVDLLHSPDGTSCGSSGPIDLCPFFSGTTVAGAPTTPTLTLPVGVPFNLVFQIFILTEAFGVGSATNVDFSHTLGLVPDGSLLNFTDPGFTVNAGDYIVNNRFVEAQAVDEPMTLALLAQAVLVVAFMGRRRIRRLAVKAPVYAC